MNQQAYEAGRLAYQNSDWLGAVTQLSGARAPGEADGRELVGREAKDGAAHGAHQLHILAGVVYEREQREHDLHLAGAEKAA